MIFFYGEGRLGNQVFQYQALSTVAREGERIYAVGLETLPEVFDLLGPKLVILTRSGLLKRLFKYVVNPLLLRPLAGSLRLVSYVYEKIEGPPPHTGASGNMCCKRGFFPNVTFVDGGHYQSANFWRGLFPAPLFKIKPKLRSEAAAYLKSIGDGSRRPSFVHVRRGDYTGFSTHGVSSLSLPEGFYREAIRTLENCVGKTHLVFVTDDADWVAQTYGSVHPKSIASFEPALDFAIMAQCGSGILSNSTFSLAAALLMDDAELVIGPQFWFGFRIRRWIPPQIKFQHERVLYVPVHAPAAQS